MSTKKMLDHEPIPGGNPDRPTRRGPTRTCTATKCTRKEYRQGLCETCYDDHVAEQGSTMSPDEITEAWDRARNS